MVENFTTIEEKTCASDLKVPVVSEDNEFEAKIKRCIQQLAKEPSQRVIDGLLDYSSSWNKGK